jgi:hypothetical protein
MMNPVPDELVKSMSNKRLWRPFNTYGIYAISAVVFFSLGYSVAII